MDTSLRDIYKPVDHTIRDWQHIGCRDGVGNTHIFNVIIALESECNIEIEAVQTFSQLCHYPSAFGKLDKSAFGRQRMRKHTIASFSSTILTMVPVLFLSLEKFASAAIPERFEAFKLLHYIFGIFRMGPRDSMRHVKTLATLITKHMDACTNLYGDYVKPKGHHMFHIIDGMLWVGCLLSCFVTERKHRLIKSCAIYVFRHIEHTVLNDVVNQSIQQVLDGHDLYSEEFLILPHDVTLEGRAFQRARKFVMKTGHVEGGDLVMTDSGLVGKVISLWKPMPTGRILLEVDVYPCINNDIRSRSTDRSSHGFFCSESIVDVLIWYEESPAIIRCVVPPALLFARE